MKEENICHVKSHFPSQDEVDKIEQELDRFQTLFGDQSAKAVYELKKKGKNKLEHEKNGAEEEYQEIPAEAEIAETEISEEEINNKSPPADDGSSSSGGNYSEDNSGEYKDEYSVSGTGDCVSETGGKHDGGLVHVRDRTLEHELNQSRGEPIEPIYRLRNAIIIQACKDLPQSMETRLTGPNKQPGAIL